MSLLTMDDVIFAATEDKIRLLVDSILITADKFKACRERSLRIGDPYTKVGVSTYIEYIRLLDELNIQFNALDNYFALGMSYINNDVY